MIPNACHSEKGDGLSLRSNPASTPPSNFMIEAWPEGDDTLTGTRFIVSHGKNVKNVMTIMNQNSCAFTSLERRKS